MSDIKWTDIGSLIVAITIPIVLHSAATELEEAQRKDAVEFRSSQVKVAVDTRTLERIRQLDSTISRAVYEKSDLDKRNHKVAPEIYEYSYVKGDEAVLSKVLLVLNEYEELCAGLNMNLYSQEIVQTLRGDALKSTFIDYKAFISQWRKEPRANRAWKQCEKFLEKG